MVCERARRRKGERERENCEAVFSSLGAFVLRGQENSAGKIIFLPHSSSPLRRCIQQPGWRRLCCSSVIVSTDSHRGFPLPIALCFFLFAIESRIYPAACRTFLDSLSSSFRRIFAVPLLASTSIDYCSLSHLRFIIRVHGPSIYRICIYVAIPVPRVSSSFHSSSSVLILSFSSLAYLTPRDLWKWAIWGELHGYLPPETYNGRFTALVNKYFLLNNIRGKRDGTMLAVHYTPRNSPELDRNRAWREMWFDLLVGWAAFLRMD